MSNTRLGILGGGQLAMMLAQAAEQLGVSCTALDPDPDCPASHACETIAADYTDGHALDTLAQVSDTITYEFENVPATSVERLASTHDVHPNVNALRTAQDRQHERELFAALEIPFPDSRPIDSAAALRAAADEIGFPCILKTRRMGYDGKGQRVLRCADDLDGALASLGSAPCVLDAFVSFERELSIIAARDLRGQTVTYPLAENEHTSGILARSTAPAPNVSNDTAAIAARHITSILDHLDYVGVLALELFDTGDTLIANEIAPRVHNTGHWTIEGAQVSQFENHVRCVTGMDALDPSPITPSAMLNVISEPLKHQITQPWAHVHDYHKQPREGRKLAHVTVTADSHAQLDERVASLGIV